MFPMMKATLNNLLRYLRRYSNIHAEVNLMSILDKSSCAGRGDMVHLSQCKTDFRLNRI